MAAFDPPPAVVVAVVVGLQVLEDFFDTRGVEAALEGGFRRGCQVLGWGDEGDRGRGIGLFCVGRVLVGFFDFGVVWRWCWTRTSGSGASRLALGVGGVIVGQGSRGRVTSVWLSVCYTSRLV